MVKWFHAKQIWGRNILALGWNMPYSTVFTDEFAKVCIGPLYSMNTYARPNVPICSHYLAEQTQLFGAWCLRAAVQQHHALCKGKYGLTILNTHPTSIRLVAELIAQVQVEGANSVLYQRRVLKNGLSSSPVEKQTWGKGKRVQTAFS